MQLMNKSERIPEKEDVRIHIGHSLDRVIAVKHGRDGKWRHCPTILG